MPPGYSKSSADIFSRAEPIGFYPVRRSDRLTTQSGYFTIHGNDSLSIDKIVPDKKKICKKIEIPPDAINNAFSFLEHAGTNQFTLFPDMDGLAEYLTENILNKSICQLLLTETNTTTLTVTATKLIYGGK